MNHLPEYLRPLADDLDLAWERRRKPGRRRPPRRLALLAGLALAAGATLVVLQPFASHRGAIARAAEMLDGPPNTIEHQVSTLGGVSLESWDDGTRLRLVERSLGGRRARVAVFVVWSGSDRQIPWKRGFSGGDPPREVAVAEGSFSSFDPVTKTVFERSFAAPPTLDDLVASGSAAWIAGVGRAGDRVAITATVGGVCVILRRASVDRPHCAPSSGFPVPRYAQPGGFVATGLGAFIKRAFADHKVTEHGRRIDHGRAVIDLRLRGEECDYVVDARTFEPISARCGSGDSLTRTTFQFLRASPANERLLSIEAAHPNARVDRRPYGYCDDEPDPRHAFCDDPSWRPRALTAADRQKARPLLAKLLSGSNTP